MRLFLLIGLLACANPSAAVVYDVVFDIAWDGSDPSGGINPVVNPHLSHVGIATHTAAAEFWAESQLATPGIALMSVTGCINLTFGACNTFPQFPTSWEQEFNAAGPAGDLLHVFEEQFAAGATHNRVFSVNAAAPFVTLASMIGPSPDWFVGFSSVNLMPGGTWINHLEIDMIVYDAGIKSDNQLIFDPFGPNETPPVPIEQLSSHALGNATIGRFVLDLQNVPEPSAGLLLASVLGLCWLLRQKAR